MTPGRVSGAPADRRRSPAGCSVGTVFGLAAIIGAAGCGAEHAPPQAIVDVETGQLYGASRDGRWVVPDAMAPGAMEGAEFVHYAKDGQRGNKAVLLPVPTAETCSNPSFRQSSDAAPGAGTYLAGNWDAAPRRATPLPADSPTLYVLSRGIDRED